MKAAHEATKWALPIVVFLAAAGCINTQSYDRSAAWTACSGETDKAARDTCMADHMADASAERAEWKRELDAEEATRDQRAGELEALGVPNGDRSTGPVRDPA